jgi:hypothetical protein
VVGVGVVEAVVVASTAAGHTAQQQPYTACQVSFTLAETAVLGLGKQAAAEFVGCC